MNRFVAARQMLLGKARLTLLVAAVAMSFAGGVPAADLYWFEYDYQPGVVGDCYRLRSLALGPTVQAPQDIVSFCARGDLPGGAHPDYDALAVGSSGVYWRSVYGDYFVAPKTSGSYSQTSLAPSIDEPDAARLAIKLGGGELDQAGTHIYRIGGEDAPYIVLADVIGGAETSLVPVAGLAPNVAIELDDTHGKIYWSGGCGGCALTIGRANFDGTSVERVGTEQYYDDFPAYLAIDPVAGKLYFANNGEATIFRADLDGTNVQTLINVGPVYSLAIDAQPIPEPRNLGLAILFLLVTLANRPSRPPRRRWRN